MENKLLNYTVITNLPVPEKQMQPHLHMCPSVCFYTLCLQPVGEIVLIQAAVNFFFNLFFPPADIFLCVYVVCRWTCIFLTVASP